MVLPIARQGNRLPGARRAALFPIWNHYRERPEALPMFLRRPDRANRLVRMEHGNIPSYDADAVHFRAKFSHDSTDHPDIRDSWLQIIKGTLTVIPVTGLHHEIIQEPYAGPLARQLGTVLDKASAEAKGAN